MGYRSVRGSGVDMSSSEHIEVLCGYIEIEWNGVEWNGVGCAPQLFGVVPSGLCKSFPQATVFVLVTKATVMNTGL